MSFFSRPTQMTVFIILDSVFFGGGNTLLQQSIPMDGNWHKKKKLPRLQRSAMEQNRKLRPIVRVSYIPGKFVLADIHNKTLPDYQSRLSLLFS